MDSNGSSEGIVDPAANRVPEGLHCLPVPPGTCLVRVDRDAGGAVRVRVAGELDRHSAQTLARALDGQLPTGVAVQLDLEGVSFMDTAAYRVLDRISYHHDGPVTVAATSRAVRRVAALVRAAASPSWSLSRD